jgi:flagellar basal body-associated protein FliL
MKKKQVVVGLIVVIFLLIASVVYVVCDVVFHGPQIVRYNQRCERIVKEENLIGQLPKAVEAALGTPTSVYWYDEVGSFTLNYAPHPWYPYAKFQVHFNDGRLKSVELYDD